MRKLLLASALMALPLAARADLQISVSEDGGAAMTSAVSTTGAITFTPTLANFGNVTISSTGFPIEANPDLATTDLSADTLSGFTGTHTLDVRVFQTGLPSTSDNLQSTFTVNNLISTPGGPLAGPSTLSDFTGGSGLTLGNPLHTDTFAQVATGTGQFGPTTVNGIVSDAQEIVVTFNDAGQSVTDTVQTIGVAEAVPEPATLMLLMTGLLGLGFVRYRRG